MEAHPRVRIRLQDVLVTFGLLGLAIGIFSSRHELTSFWHLLKIIRWYVLTSIVIVQVASYWMNALYYRSILRLFGYKISTGRLFAGALASNFVNYVIPSAGLAGAGYLSQVLSPEVPRGQSVLTQLMRYALSALAVLVMMPVGFLSIVLGGDTGRPIVRITLVSAATMTVVALSIVALISHERLLRRVVDRLLRTTKHLHINFSGQRDIEHFIDEFYVGYHIMVHKKWHLFVSFAWSMAYIVIEILTFYLSFLAFGRVVNIGIVIMAYLFANIASITGGAFFSTGIFELGMAGTLVALGLPLTLAISVTTVFRVLSLLTGLPPGFFYYRKYLPHPKNR